MSMRLRLIALLGLALLAAAPSAKAVNAPQFSHRPATTNRFTVVDDGVAPGSKIVTTDRNGVENSSIPTPILDGAGAAILAFLRIENPLGGGNGLLSSTTAIGDGTNITQQCSGIIRINRPIPPRPSTPMWCPPTICWSPRSLSFSARNQAADATGDDDAKRFRLGAAPIARVLREA
jgi:hypothetical protein